MSFGKLVILISCFNEEEMIEECLQRVLQVVPAAQIVVVHGGKDKTADKAEAMAALHPQIKVIRNLHDRGKGHGIKVGLRAADGEVMLQMDADLQFQPEEIPRVLKPIYDGLADVCFGCRFMKNSNVENYQFSFFRVIGNHLVNYVLSLLAGQRFYDVTTGFKAWTKKAIMDINFKDDRFVYEAEIAMRGVMKGCRFAMVPITYFNRLGGVSGHGQGWKETVSIVLTGFKILWYSVLIRLGLW